MDKLLKILHDLHPEIDFTTHGALIADKVLDSFDIISLIAEVDDEFGVRIPPLEIVPENFNSAAALCALITRLMDE